jgi:hypothetical protein
MHHGVYCLMSLHSAHRIYSYDSRNEKKIIFLNSINKFALIMETQPVTVAERSKASTVFARSDAGVAGSNPTQDMDVCCVYVFILCLCCPVFK